MKTQVKPKRSAPRLKGSRRQQGVVVVIVTIALLAMLGAAALAIDINHAFMNRTKLQNGVDAAALAAAVVLNKSGVDQNAVQNAASQAAKDALTKMGQSSGNAEVTVPDANIAVTFNNDSRFTGGSCVLGGDCYVRVAVSDLTLQSFFIQLFTNTKAISASAVAGPSAGGDTCNVVPMAICANDATNQETAGFEDGVNYEIKLSENNSEMGPGNFQLLDLEVDDSETKNAQDNHIRNQLAGNFQGCVGKNDIVTTKPGNTIGPVGQGINTRFGEYKGGTSSSEFTSDGVTTENITHDEYLANDLHNGRREIAVPIVDCTSPSSGSQDFSVVAVGCFFLVEKAPDNNSGKDSIVGEYMYDCTVQNSHNDGESNTGGSYRIVLYKDPLNEDS